MFPFVLVALALGAAGAAVYAFGPRERPLPNRRTDWPKVNALLPLLNSAADSAGMPLGLFVGWVAVESGGDLASTGGQPLKGETDVERGLFQLAPSESAKLGIDHKRLSTDAPYSVAGGVLAIQHLYQPAVDALGVAEPGTAYYWRLVKLCHTIGVGGTGVVVHSALSAGRAGSWSDLEAFAVKNDAQLAKSIAGLHTAKWFPVVDKVYQIGGPFGFGEGA